MLSLLQQKSDIGHTDEQLELAYMNPSRIHSLSSHPGPTKIGTSTPLPMGKGKDYSEMGPILLPEFSNSLVDECGGE